MKSFKLFVISFLLISAQSFGQYDYWLYRYYADSSTREQNTKVKTVTQFKSEDKRQWTKISCQQFNSQGALTEIIEFDEKGNIASKKKFIYNDKQAISKIETYHDSHHVGTSVFQINSAGQVIGYTDYADSTYGNKEMLFGKLLIEYNTNGTVSKEICLKSGGQDTLEIRYYDTAGRLTKSIENQTGLQNSKITYSWNDNKTRLTEVDYQDQEGFYDTVIHKYNAHREIERIDPGRSAKPLYWKYDKNGRIIETNEDVFEVKYFTYNAAGYLTAEIMDVLFSDVKDLQKKFYLKFEYVFR